MRTLLIRWLVWWLVRSSTDNDGVAMQKAASNWGLVLSEWWAEFNRHNEAYRSRTGRYINLGLLYSGDLIEDGHYGRGLPMFWTTREGANETIVVDASSCHVRTAQDFADAVAQLMAVRPGDLSCWNK